MTRRIRGIYADRRGATVVEFAIVAPVISLLLLGAFDTAHSLYMRSVLQGVVQKVARDSALEAGTVTAQQTVLDNKVRASVKAIANNADITITRRYYRTFSAAAAAQAETWTDTNGNGTCDAGEPYQDANNNTYWDGDGGDGGQGGAKDKTVYTVAMTYPRYFPLYRIIGGSNTTNITASTVLANQPYGDQGSYGPPTVRNCP
ncbi:MAG: pilus assembly protein [Candidatus Sphingomonas phytovorans]|nr:TadE family protein [Sphingomonas sp.]WEK01087.1 MAG: pilus assembly protein [Sphingomonas sp.]